MTPRLSPDPLIERCRVVAEQPDAGSKTIARVLDISPRTVVRWKTDGYQLSVHWADRYAVRLGLHPCQLWPEWFDLPIDELEAGQQRLFA